ncbi:MAG: Crp/Fnr family transcriptional regulator [Bacteroidales bacterium]|nr:Crp/Fnr family transcriptional regulator [Bacteroidales bacterium]MCF8405148.1 Crp/Fnr family transcriptional regulator [Bacteroidales bacterium]
MNDENLRTSCTVAHENCECFEFLTEEQKLLVEERQRIVHYKKGEIIAKHGAFASHVIFLCEGLVKVYYESGNDSLILKIMSPGNLVGLSSLQKDENVFQYTASAYIDSVARLIDINLFKKFIVENGRFASEIIHIMSENTNQINSRFFGMIHRQSYGKLADLILCLAGRIFKEKKFELHLTRKELAELAGMSTESVIRILKKFQDEGYIKISGKTFEIINLEGLQRICDLG